MPLAADPSYLHGLLIAAGNSRHPLFLLVPGSSILHVLKDHFSKVVGHCAAIVFEVEKLQRSWCDALASRR